MSKKYKWYNLVFISLLLIVVGHFVNFYTKSSHMSQSIYLFVSIFDVPLLLLALGVLLKKYVNKLDKNIIFGLIFLGVILKIIFYLIDAVFTNANFSVFTESGVPVYLFVLAVYIFITHYLKDIKPKYVFTFAVLIALFAGYDNTIRDEFALSRIIVFYPFFLAGYYLNQKKLFKIIDNKKYKILSAIIVLFAFITCVFGLDYVYCLRALFTGRNPYDYVKIDNCFFAYRILTYLISAILVIAMITLIPNKNIKYITEGGMRGMQIYFIHDIIIKVLIGLGFVTYLQKIIPYGWLVIIVIMGIGLTFLLSAKCLEKPFKIIMNSKETK